MSSGEVGLRVGVEFNSSTIRLAIWEDSSVRILVDHAHNLGAFVAVTAEDVATELGKVKDAAEVLLGRLVGSAAICVTPECDDSDWRDALRMACGVVGIVCLRRTFSAGSIATAAGIGRADELRALVLHAEPRHTSLTLLEVDGGIQSVIAQHTGATADSRAPLMPQIKQWLSSVGVRETHALHLVLAGSSLPSEASQLRELFLPTSQLSVPIPPSQLAVAGVAILVTILGDVGTFVRPNIHPINRFLDHRLHDRYGTTCQGDHARMITHVYGTSEDSQFVADELCADVGLGSYQSLCESKLLDEAACMALRHKLDAAGRSGDTSTAADGAATSHSAKTSEPSQPTDRKVALDLQLDLTKSELEAAIGSSAVSQLLLLFSGAVGVELVVAEYQYGLRAIRLRRVEASGHCVPFHVDLSCRTMQVALNDEHEYAGGRLVYVTHTGFECPPRPAGSATIHGHRIVHGVTELHEGVRYSLFLLGHTYEQHGEASYASSAT